MKDNLKKPSAGKVLRMGALALAGVLAWQVITPPMASFISAIAEDGGPLGKIYNILSDNIGEPGTPQDCYELANISIGKGEYEQALSQLESARSLITGILPSPDEIQTEVGNETTDAENQTSVGNETNAEEQTEVGVQNPLSEEDTALLAEISLKIASVYLLLGRTDEAVQALNETLEITPESTQALLLKARLAVETGDYPAAAADFKAYLQLVPDDASSRQTLAQLLEALADFPGAIAEYELLYQAYPEDESYLLNGLRCYFLNGQYAEAIAGFDAYNERHADDTVDPYGGIADFLRAASYMQLGDYATAGDGFEAAIAAGYDQAACLEQITLCRFESGEYDKVLIAGETLLNLEGATLASKELVHQRMGLASMRLNDYENAMIQLDLAGEINPALEGNEYYRGVCLLSLNRKEEAAEAFTASIENGYLLQFCYYNRGVCYVDLLEYEKAIDDMAMVLETGDDPDLIAAAKDLLWQLANYFEQLDLANSTTSTDQ